MPPSPTLFLAFFAGGVSVAVRTSDMKTNMHCAKLRQWVPLGKLDSSPRTTHELYMKAYAQNCLLIIYTSVEDFF